MNMKQFKDIKNKLEWEEYYDPTFNWNDFIFYRNNELTEEFIREFKDRVNWIYISVCQKLSEDFIREFEDIVDWYWISRSQKLSEDFIREFEDKVNWNMISKFQKLSEEFIKEFKNKVDMIGISERPFYISKGISIF